MYLPEELVKEARYLQENFLNDLLREAVINSPEIKEKFNEIQLEQIYNGDKSDDFSLHHHQEYKRMQFVDFDIHSTCNHTGGWSIWCQS